jgi:hypothetical protein
MLKVQVAAESLIGSETSAGGTARLSLTPFTFFEPHAMTQDSYMELLASGDRPNVSVRSAKTKVKLSSSSSSKLKKHFRRLSATLNGHEVEYLENKAMSVCSKVYHQGGIGEFTIICALLKASSSSGKSISVDIKCFGRDATVCQRIADETVAVVDQVSLL